MSETERVMVDIETLGLEPGAAILSIGAVEFGPDGLGDEFYREISIESCQEFGLDLDAGTLRWWLSQDDDVAEVLKGSDELDSVLSEFGCWYRSHEFEEIWANAPAFDCEHLEVAYDAVNIAEPWEYHEERDVRTLRNLPGAVELEMDGDEHHSLDDAKYQAQIVSETLRSLRTGTEFSDPHPNAAGDSQ